MFFLLFETKDFRNSCTGAVSWGVVFLSLFSHSILLLEFAMIGDCFCIQAKLLSNSLS